MTNEEMYNLTYEVFLAHDIKLGLSSTGYMYYSTGAGAVPDHTKNVVESLKGIGWQVIKSDSANTFFKSEHYPRLLAVSFYTDVETRNGRGWNASALFMKANSTAGPA